MSQNGDGEMADLLFSDLIVNVLIIAISFVALNWASNIAINHAIKVSNITQLGKTAVGFSLIAFSTSLPELTVALIAAVSGGAAISVGNVFGSNIVNICVIIGLAALLLHLKRIKGKVRLKELFVNWGNTPSLTNLQNRTKTMLSQLSPNPN